MSLSPPSCHWEGLTVNFITDLPDSTASGYTGILVIIDHVTEMATYLLCKSDINSWELARMFFEHVICKRGVPVNITTNQGKQCTSRFWNRVCTHLWINHRRSTAFRLQTDGQSERQTWTMEEYIRAFCNHEKDNWGELLPLAEFVYKTPFTIPHWWLPSGRTTITILRCNLCLPSTPVSDHRCRQTHGWQVWKRLTKFSGKT